MNFDMNRTWSQAVALVRANFQLLAIVAGVFVLLPTLAFYLLNPDLLRALGDETKPAQLQAVLEAIMPRLLMFGLVVFVVEMIGQAALVALVGHRRPTVGQAIKTGARALPSVIGAIIVFMFGLWAIAFVISLPLAIVGMLIGGGSGGATALAGGPVGGVISILILMLEAYLMVRFMMTLPVIVLEHRFNPLTALRRSWRLTAPCAWRMLAFVILLAIAYVVIVLLVMLVIGAIGLAAGSNSASGQMGAASQLGFAVVTSLIGAAVAMLVAAILVSIHRQLTGGGEAADVEFDA